jgi:CheY-like chemotaxis protein
VANRERSRSPERYVLVVDDDDDMRDVLEASLASDGIRTVSADNGATAAHVIARFGAPLAVVSDLHMPVLDGLDLVRALRRHRASRGVPILLVTGDQQPPDMPPGIEVTEKPLGTDALLEFARRQLVRAEAGRDHRNTEAAFAPSRGRDRPTVVVNPAADRVFAEFSEMVVDDGVGSTDELERRLRAIYPRATVHRRSLDGEAHTVWYVYRDGPTAQGEGSVRSRNVKGHAEPA